MDSVGFAPEDICTTGGPTPTIPMARVFQFGARGSFATSLVTWPELTSVGVETTETSTPTGSAWVTDVHLSPLAPLAAGWYAVRVAGSTPFADSSSSVVLDDGSAIARFGVDVPAQPSRVDASGGLVAVYFSEPLAGDERWTGDIGLVCGGLCPRGPVIEGALGAAFDCGPITADVDCILTVDGTVPTRDGRVARVGDVEFGLRHHPPSGAVFADELEPLL